MTNKVRSILGSIFGWISGLIVMLAFKDNTKKTMTIAAQAICISGVMFAWGIVAVILAIIPIIKFIALIASPVIYIGCSVFWIINIVKACQYDTVQSTEIPLFGSMANAIFGKVIAKGVDFEPVEANGGAVDPNMGANPNMNQQPNPNMNQGPVNPGQPVQPQQPFTNPNNPNNPNNMNQ